MIEAIRQFLNGTQQVVFSVKTRKPERCRWVQKALVKHRYMSLCKADNRSPYRADSGLSPPSHPTATTRIGTAPVKALRAMPGAPTTE